MQGKEPEKDEAADVRFLLISGAALTAVRVGGL
jgi:hypothetical protein